MPPKIQVSREQIIDAAMRIIDKSGYDALTARSIAAELGVSTQPIYREFQDMDALRYALYYRGFEEFALYCQHRGGDSKSGALAQSVAYIRFAIERSNLFKMLYMNRILASDSLEQLSHNIVDSNGLIEKIMEITGLSLEDTYKLHLVVWMATHGLASIACTNNVKWTDEELSDFTMMISKALSGYLKETK